MARRDEVIAATFAAIDRHLRPTSLAQVGGFRPPDDPVTSAFGGRFVAAANAGWPLSDGQPMLPLLQVRTDELPCRPMALDGIALFNVFVSARQLPWPLPAENGHGWLLRSYPTLDGLVPFAAPAELPLRPFPVRWQRAEGEGPDWDDAWDLYDLSALNELDDAIDLFYDRYNQHDGTKIGGWPGYIQASPGSAGYVLQISSEAKAGWWWGDRGNGYVYFRDGKWLLHWDCY